MKKFALFVVIITSIGCTKVSHYIPVPKGKASSMSPYASYNGVWKEKVSNARVWEITNIDTDYFKVNDYTYNETYSVDFKKSDTIKILPLSTRPQFILYSNKIGVALTYNFTKGDYDTADIFK